METFCQANDVVNDAAKRCIKLCHDFIASSTGEHKLQYILQVVEKSRASLTNQGKMVTTDDGEKKWFLQLG